MLRNLGVTEELVNARRKLIAPGRFTTAGGWQDAPKPQYRYPIPAVILKRSFQEFVNNANM